jgi:glutamine synthetase
MQQPAEEQKEVISGTARQAGLEVTFLPKPLAGFAGNYCL